MSKRVLLTGVAGFAGSHILEHLLSNTDWDIVGIASWKHKGTPERVEEALRGDKGSFVRNTIKINENSLDKPIGVERPYQYKSWRDRVEIITHDLESPFTEMTKKRIGKIDYVLNIASESHVERSITDPVPFVKNNVNLILTMLEFAREAKPELFLQFSTDEVYGVAPYGVNHKEWSPIVPSNPYSASKAAQEAIAISYWRTYGVPLVITNTMNLFGETQDSEKFIAKTIRATLKGDRVTVHGKPGRIGSRYYLHARNMADAVLYIVKNLPPRQYIQDENLIPDRYNIVGDIELNNLEMAETIAELCQKELKYDLVDHHTTRPGHDYRYALDGEKLRGLGWKAPLDFKASLKKYIDWTLKNTLWL